MQPKVTVLQIQWSYPQLSLGLLYFLVFLGWCVSDSGFHFMYLSNVLCFCMAFMLLALTIVIYKILPQTKPRSICFLVASQTSWNIVRSWFWMKCRADTKMRWIGISDQMTWNPWRTGTQEWDLIAQSARVSITAVIKICCGLSHRQQ